MKKIIAFLLTMILVVSLIGCSGGNDSSTSDSTAAPAASDTSPADTSENAPDTSESKLESIIEYPTLNGGAGPLGLLYEGELLRYNMISSDDGLEDFYPVYKNPYPYGQSGPHYTVTDSDRAQMENTLRAFLPLIFDEAVADGLELKTYELEVGEGQRFETRYAEHDGIKVSTGVADVISITLDGTVLEGTDVKNDPAGNPYIKTALDRVGITEPVITEDLRFEGVYEDYRNESYYIYDKAALESADRTFAYVPYVKVTLSNSRTTVGIYNTFDIFKLESTDCPTVSYTDALEYVKVNYPHADMSTLVCRTVYDSEACIGYYVPIYYFFFENDTTVDSDFLQEVKISAVEFTPEVELH